MQPVLGYWKLRGLGQSIRLMLKYTGTNFTEKRYEFRGSAPNFDRSQWLDEKFRLGLPLPNLPYYIDGPHRITQSNAIRRYIARKHDLCGTTEEEIVKVDMLENQAMDLRKSWVQLVNTPDNFEANKVTYINETLPAYLKLLNEFIGTNEWFTGNKISLVDFMLYESLDTNKALASECLNDFQNLQSFIHRFETLDAIKKYMDSSEFIKNPINGPGSLFGAK